MQIVIFLPSISFISSYYSTTSTSSIAIHLKVDLNFTFYPNYSFLQLFYFWGCKFHYCEFYFKLKLYTNINFISRIIINCVFQIIPEKYPRPMGIRLGGLKYALYHSLKVIPHITQKCFWRFFFYQNNIGKFYNLYDAKTNDFIPVINIVGSFSKIIFMNWATIYRIFPVIGNAFKHLNFIFTSLKKNNIHKLAFRKNIFTVFLIWGSTSKYNSCIIWLRSQCFSKLFLCIFYWKKKTTKKNFYETFLRHSFQFVECFILK